MSVAKAGAARKGGRKVKSRKKKKASEKAECLKKKHAKKKHMPGRKSQVWEGKRERVKSPVGERKPCVQRKIMGKAECGREKPSAARKT